MSEYPASTPEPPYYMVIFSSVRTAVEEGYGSTADRMEELAQQQPGYLGMESVRGADGAGITISYWASEEAIAGWSKHAEHVVAKRTGVKHWYERYVLRVGMVERQRVFERP